MGILNKGTDFQAGDTVTATSLNELVENATFDNGSNQATDNSSLAVHSSGYLEVKDGGVTLGKMANLAANSVIGNNTSSPATPSAVGIDTLTSTVVNEITNNNTIEIGTDGLADNSVTAAKLAHTTVSAGSYTNTNLTVDAQGRITAASNGSSSSGTFTRNTVTNHNNSTKSGNVSFNTFTGTWTGSGNAANAFTFIIESAKIGNISNTLVTLNTPLFPSSGDLTVNSGDTLVVHDFIYFDPLMTTGTAPTGIIGAHLPVFNDRTNQLIGRANVQQQLSSLPTNSGVNTTLHLYIRFNQSVLFNKVLGNGIAVGNYNLISK